MASIARNSLARFVADGAGLVFGMAFGIITARYLGPSGKGLVSAVTFLGGFVMQACFLGLGDAAIVAVGQKRSSLQDVLSASFAILVPAALLGMAVMWGASLLEFHNDWNAARIAVFVTCVAIPVNLVNQTVGNLLNAEERFLFTSSMLVVSSATIVVTAWIFVVWLHWAVFGAVLAPVCGVGLSAAITCALMAKKGLSFRPRLLMPYLRFALSYGPKVQLSNILVTAAARFDLLLVYALAGQAAAGQYSVALTIGALSTMLPFALTLTSFPRLAALPDVEAVPMTMRLNRAVIASALVASVGIGAVSPVFIPLAFGRAFGPAIKPTFILLLGGILAGSQYLLARARAARGMPGLLLRSYLLNTVVMVLLDLLLIPRFNVNGAALASTIGNAAGLIVSCQGTRAADALLRMRDFLPGIDDFRDLLQIPWRIFFPTEKIGSGS